MEDPVTFDVYGIVQPDATQSAAEFLEKSGTYPTRLEALKSVREGSGLNT